MNSPNKAGNKTRYSDKMGRKICYGDLIHVEEYPDRYVGDSLNYEGIVEWDDEAKQTVVTYWDIGFSEATPLSIFPIKGREIIKPMNDLEAKFNEKEVGEHARV